MEGGWIKIFTERLLEWEWYHDTKMVRVFLHILLKANYRSKRFEGIEIKRGQLVTSLANMSAELGLSVKSIRTCLNKLQTTGEIGKQTASKFTIITVCKYDKYQGLRCDEGQANGKQTASEGQARGKQRASKGQQLKNIRKKEYNNNITPSKEGESVDTDQPVDVDLKSVVEFFNKSVVESNSVLPKIKGATGKRVGYIKARIREFGIEAVYEVISKAAASDFINGKNQRGWVASFDWIMLPTNFPKVLEGNYDNRTNNYNETNNHQSSVGCNPTNTVTGFVVHRSKN